MKESLGNSALTIGSIILAIVVLEIGLRAYHDEWEYVNFRFPTQNQLVTHSYDTELGWLPRSSNPSWPSITIFKEGIRSNGRGEVWDGADDAILAVGDSFTFGLNVADSETWPAQLERLLAGRRVINGGVAGYGVDQIFLRARRLLTRYRFSTVIFSFIPDDIRRSQMSEMYRTAKPYFDFKDGRLTLENVPVPPTFRADKESAVLIALEHSRLVHAVMKRLLPEWWFRAPYERQVQDREKGIRVSCSLLHEVERLAKLRSSELIVLVQHRKDEIPSEDTTAENVLSCLSDPGTRVLDLMAVLSELQIANHLSYDSLYFPIDMHMTAEGNQFVALELLKILTQGGTQVDGGLPEH